ncbi:MAG: hypothetical protein OEM49_02415 [Myxococcales bacterium]|nr:hypothetical protein [Myxococcales bacterium]MDH5306309.1 hypothetical protein [Myxococcales bacterium]MDH5567144.1 hypothetical protein [Myxococcales bacterium]
MLCIPRAPRELTLPIDRMWSGAPCPELGRHGWVRLAWEPQGVVLVAGMPHPPVSRVPDAPIGRRVPDLWNYDVVECFLAGAGGRYLEVELGAGGHFLLLSFDAPRRLVDDHAGFQPALAFETSPRGWRARLCVPWVLLPPELCALNAFAIVGALHLAHHPLPGDVPDFHQPARFPPAALERG